MKHPSGRFGAFVRPVMRNGALALVLLASASVVASASFDHSGFDAPPRQHVANGMVDYDAFRPEGPERRLLLSGRFKLVGTRYDWTLNRQEQARKLKLAPAAERP